MTSLRSAVEFRRPVVVAIPAKDEADRIGACLTAIDRQDFTPDFVTLLLNNCTDGTAEVVRSMRPKLGFRLGVISCILPPERASAGHARRVVMQRAATLAGPDGALLTTDADAEPPPDWISRNIRAIDAGADVVCGRAVINPDDEQAMPARLRHEASDERRLIALQDRFAALLDPEPHDPAPRHTEAPGASLALTVAAFRRIGGVPARAYGEDRALVRALWECDARVRHDPAVSVIVSGRTEGRAAGGMAETLRRRLNRQDAFADEQAEPTCHAWRRYALRYRARRCWAGERDPALAADLGVSLEGLWWALHRPYFGGAWAMLERISSVLARRRVRFVDLPAEIAMARGLLAADKLAAD